MPYLLRFQVGRQRPSRNHGTGIHIMTKKIVAALAATFALAACGAASTDAGTQASTTSTATATSASKPATPKTTAKPKPAAPKLSNEAQEAKESAQSYLDMSGFSKKGLVKQLQFEGFKAADITAAMATMKVDWNAEAAESAKSYVDMSSFSRASLIKQLTFEGFTAKEAAFGATAAGL